MSQPRVLVDKKAQRAGVPGSGDQGWGLVWLFSLILVAAGMGDTLLAFIPPRFGVPEWEFGTVASSFSALPLITMGLVGLLASALARGRRLAVIMVSWTFILISLGILVLYLLFLSNAPIALGQVQGDIRLGIMKAIVKTSWLGLIFGLGYLIGGIAALRYLRRAGS